MPHKFEGQFAEWLSACFEEGIPATVKGFALNLYQPAGKPAVKFGVELVGAGRFDAGDSDWPCDEVWVPKVRGIDIPIDFSGEQWEDCLARTRQLLVALLQANSVVSARIQAVEGFGIGFVDGDLEIVTV